MSGDSGDKKKRGQVCRSIVVTLALALLSSPANATDPRPARWCGWWLRQHLGVSDRSLNLARNWARYGSNANGPGYGVIVVWRHHVGIITGSTATGWIVKSGNDGGRVRERERNLRGVIAYRRQGYE